jgi:hypothetical protein
MRHAAILPSLFALLFGLTIACPLPAFAAGYDGEWTVPPPHRATATAPTVTL